MLAQLFTSKTRIKLLTKLFLNPHVSCYLRELAMEFSLSPNAVKGELDNLSEAGYLTREQEGRSVFFSANKNHPFFPEISSIIRKSTGIDTLVEQVMKDLGNVEHVYILDDYAEGRDSGLIDILIIGDVNQAKLDNIRTITEKKINRKIRTMSVSADEFAKSREMYMKRPNWKII